MNTTTGKTAAAPAAGNQPDVSQGAKATGGTEGAAALTDPKLNPVPAEQPPTATGAKASDIPADHIMDAAGNRAEASDARQPQTNEYTLSGPHLQQIAAQHFGINPNAGQIELRWDEANNALVFRHTV